MESLKLKLSDYTKFYCEKCKKDFYVKGKWIMAACPICFPMRKIDKDN